MNITKMNHYLQTMHDVANVREGARYWYFKLLNLVMDMFEYDGLPEGMERREIELNLLVTGHCLIVAKRDGTLWTPLTQLYGFDEYYQPTNAVWANPVNRMKSYKYTIGEDCEVVYNSSLKDSIWYVKSDSGLNSFISRYARQLADLEATANIYAVNARLVSIPVTNDNSVKESLSLFFKNLVLGKRSIVSDSTIVEKFRNVDINRSNVKDGMNDWLIARDKVLEQFYRDLGVRMNQQKKAQVNAEEVESNDQLLLIASDDMLRERQEGFERVNTMYGTNISVRLNPLFDVKIVNNEMTSQEEGDNDETLS